MSAVRLTWQLNVCLHLDTVSVCTFLLTAVTDSADSYDELLFTLGKMVDDV